MDACALCQRKRQLPAPTRTPVPCTSADASALRQRGRQRQVQPPTSSLTPAHSPSAFMPGHARGGRCEGKVVDSGGGSGGNGGSEEGGRWRGGGGHREPLQNHHPPPPPLAHSRVCYYAGYQAWQYIMRTYKATDDLYISQLEKKLTNIRMGDQESATEYCNRARRYLADLQMAGVDFLVASYVTHVISGLPSGNNLMPRMPTVPGTRETLDEDSLSSHIIQDEFMQES
ncbi:unnamed protein product [Closterium sp. NIES-54]